MSGNENFFWGEKKRFFNNVLKLIDLLFFIKSWHAMCLLYN